jgi:hypothetical protein
MSGPVCFFRKYSGLIGVTGHISNQFSSASCEHLQACIRAGHQAGLSTGPTVGQNKAGATK